jgi:hypothetical protein
MTGCTSAIRNVIGFDVCETAQQSSGFYVNQRPPEQLIALFRLLRERYLLMPITGQVQEVVERLGRLCEIGPFYLSAVEFGAQIINKQRGTWMLPNDATGALMGAKAALIPFMRENNAEPDPRDLSGFFSFWFHRGGDKKADRMVPKIEKFLDENVPVWRQHLEIKRWPRGEVLFKPKCLSKGIVTDWLTMQGYNLVIGAGDTPSDIPLLKAAQFGIVTHALDEKPHPDVIKVAETCSRGYYVAKPDEPHGYGLAAGLLAAREAGVLSF